MVSRFGPKDFAACGRCGSGQVHPKLLVMGPIAGIDSDSRTFVCHACGHEGLPIFFDTQEARAQFEREKKGLWDAEPKAAKKGVLTIPILPIQADPLIALKILEHLPVRVATVEIAFADGTRLTERVEAVRGTPRNPMTRAEVIDKARDLVVPVLGAETFRRLSDTVFALETLPNVRALGPLLQRR